MSRTIPYLFCRYQMTIHDEPLTGDEQLELLTDLRGRMVAHRKANPSPLDEDTFIMKPKQKAYEGQYVLTWHVAQHVNMRQRTKYDRDNDDVVDEAVETDEVRHTKIIALPTFGVLAVDDRLSERSLGGKSAISRFKSVFSTVSGGQARVEFAGTSTDLSRALETWALDKFTFSVRPFNPTIRKPGAQLHEMMIADGIGEMRAIAKPKKGESMRDSHEGLITEAVGLTEHGYGQVALSGRTPGGRTATFGGVKFDQDKERNKKEQAKSRPLKIQIDEMSTVEEEEAEIVKALLEFFGD